MEPERDPPPAPSPEPAKRFSTEQLIPLLYKELRTLARSYMARCAPGMTLQPTALVHEAYIRLSDRDDPVWENRGHFFAAAARAMRQILVDQIRRRRAVKHGGGQRRLGLDDVEIPFEPPTVDILALDEALTSLERHQPRHAEIVMLRYFAGLSTSEIAAILNISPRTVDRDWAFARSFLAIQLKEK